MAATDSHVREMDCTCCMPLQSTIRAGEPDSWARSIPFLSRQAPCGSGLNDEHAGECLDERNGGGGSTKELRPLNLIRRQTFLVPSAIQR